MSGATGLDLDAIAAKIAEIRACSELPLGVGFGIDTAERAAAVAALADAVIVGSALVARVEAHAATPEDIPGAVCGLVAEMRTALDALQVPAAEG